MHKKKEKILKFIISLFVLPQIFLFWIRKRHSEWLSLYLSISCWTSFIFLEFRGDASPFSCVDRKQSPKCDQISRKMIHFSLGNKGGPSAVRIEKGRKVSYKDQTSREVNCLQMIRVGRRRERKSIDSSRALSKNSKKRSSQKKA